MVTSINQDNTPGVSFTEASFQNLFLSADAGLAGSGLSACPLLSNSACFFFRARRSSFVPCGGCGGGPGTVGCGKGVAVLDELLCNCRHAEIAERGVTVRRALNKEALRAGRINRSISSRMCDILMVNFQRFEIRYPTRSDLLAVG